MIVPEHLRLIPVDITNTPLLPTDRAPLDAEGHRLQRCAFQPAVLAHHAIKELSARLTTRKTIVTGRLELPQCAHAAFHSAGDEVKSGKGIAGMVGPAGW
jgi:hypothetical protein